VPGGVYHVMLRGNGGQEVFFTDDDRLYFYTDWRKRAWAASAIASMTSV
jgi:hypothetical protein